MIIHAQHHHTAELLARGLRAADVQECFNMLGHGPEVALPNTVDASERVWAWLREGKVWALFGVATWPTAHYVGAPWFVCADEVGMHRKDLVRLVRPYVAKMGAGYQCLSNFVEESHSSSIRWLEYAGFKFIQRYPEFGAARVPFLQFYKAV